MSSLVSTLVGAAVTWIVAWFYYKRAGDELRRETALLKKATSAIIYFLENPGSTVHVRRDADGEVVGITVSARGEAAGTSEAKGVGETAP